MQDDAILTGHPIEDDWLPLELAAVICPVELEWLLCRIDEGLLTGAENVAGHWRLSAAGLLRARRMREVERDFEAEPELAALVADLLEQMDALRGRLRRAGIPPLQSPDAAP
ncbi:MerR family transcriptional regulator [Denitratisoma sp. DHT3]|uniref:MerR family transcriptional regulator n=1 Tax=Denitratisoma sp. DHT3 TaxID=1981880 RepID=UPI001198C341|nr:MerR family transcriptional regulator [Denitratisoma sp. DHT3]QDX82070.1 MerR family transcriptional regulator [Denitratisoma sp. DHT3]